jgi:phosphohistidine phosphatase
VIRLYLLRHAKSSWDDPALADRERPLAPRGRAALRLMAGHLAREGIVPELVLCSPAQRAQETLEGIAAAIGDGADVETEEELYGASADDLLERLQKIPATVSSVMLIGHNPALVELAARLAGDDGEGLERLERKYPTGALATLSFDEGWVRLAPGTGRLVEFVRPKDLR